MLVKRHPPRHVAAGVLLPFALLLTACPQNITIHIADGSTADHLTFTFSENRGLRRSVQIRGLWVRLCDTERKVWEIEGMAGADTIERIIYGVVPQGFLVRTPAERLGPGCYEVDVAGSGESERFVVQENGNVIS